MKIRLFCLFFSIVAPCFFGPAEAGHRIQVSPELELYYEEAGSGPPMIMITGWTGTSEVFLEHQFPHFAKQYRVLAYDPRSHGHSGRTLESHTYLQHGRDLRAFMDALKLKQVVLVAWSWGCHDAFGYFRTYGTDNVRAFVCIDQPPRSLPIRPGDWSDFADFAEVGPFLQGLAYDRRTVMREFIPTMMQRKMSPQEIDWVLNQCLRTPDYVATLLAVDATFSDYSEEARKIDGRIPVLMVSSESRAQAAKTWLGTNAPHAELAVLGNHMMFREYPDRFNTLLQGFLQRLGSR